MKKRRIKYYLLIGLTIVTLVFSDINIYAITYYISSSGNDRNSGIRENEPWQSLAKVNRFAFRPGDQILFKRGETWTGTITVKASGTSASPIIYGAYGTGVNPVISGFTTPAGWTDEGGGVYSKAITVEGGALNMVTVDGVNTAMGRWPNAGTWLTYESHVDHVSITDNQLTGTPNWTGAEAVIRKIKWSLERCIITNHTNSVITFNEEGTTWNPTNGFGYFIQNDLKTLDVANEWYFDPATNKFYIYGNPSAKTVKISTINRLLVIYNKHYITVENITFEGANSHAIQNTSGQNIVIQNCTFENIGMTAIYTDANSVNASLTIDGNTINTSNNNAIHLRGSNTYSWIKNNTISNIGVIHGSATNEPLSTGEAYNAISVRGANSIIEYNTISNIGHSGIAMRSNTGMNIRYNYISNFGLTRYDAGGIYLWGQHGATINNNIVDGSNHISEGIAGSTDLALNGIYIDNDCSNIMVIGNTVHNCTGRGLYILNANNTIFANNTSFNNDIQLGMTYAFGYGVDITGMIIKNNKLIAKTAEQVVFRYRNDTSPLNQFGIADSNYYTRLNDDDYTIQTQVNAKVTNRTLTEWKTITGQDTNSTFISIKLSKGETEKLFYNKTKQIIKFYLGKSVFRDVFRNNIIDSFSLEPFTSKILIGKDFDLINQKPKISDQSFNITSPKFLTDSIGQVFAYDADTGQVLKFSIVLGNELDYFLIDSISGGIYITNEINTSKDLSIDLIIQVTDNSVNSLSDSAGITINIEGWDLSPPVITSFSIPSIAFSLTFPIDTFKASDDLAVVGFLLTEYPDVPNPNDTSWSSSAPLFFSFSNEGVWPVYAWAKDASGNISAPVLDSIIITLPDLSPKYSEYLFEETEGIDIIDSNDINNGNIIDEVVRGEGVSGKGLNFTGSGYINLGRCFGENVQNEVTLSVWLNPYSLYNGEDQGIIMHGGPDIESYALYINPADRSIGFKTSGTSSPLLQLSNINDLWDGNWHHLAAVYNGSEKLIYLDGKVLITAKATGPIDSGFGYNLLMGAGRDEKNPSLLFQGELDEVRIYNYALNESETENLYHSINRIIKKTYITEHISICEGENYLGWTEPGEYIRVLHRLQLSASGADSIITTNLVVQPVYQTSEHITILEGENYLGWITSEIHERTLTSSTGCDSIIITNLTVAFNKHTVENITICDGNTYEGLTTSGQYQRILKAVSGADSLVTTHLTVNQVVQISEEVKIWEGESYQGWTESGQYEHILTSVTGCDSFITTTLRVEPLQNQSIDLAEGWNIFSSCLIPSNLTLDNVFENLKIDNVLIEVQDEDGKTYYEGGNGWINNIGELQQSKGYKIMVKSYCILKITGKPVKLPLNIQLKAGWNIISFPYPGSANAMEVIQSLIDDGILEKVQDEKGNSIENWGNSIGWINGIGDLIAGEGYLVEVNKDGVLPILEEYEKSVLILSDQSELTHFKKIFEGNGFCHMNINITGLSESNLQVGDELAAYDGNACVGAVKLSHINIDNNIVSIQASVSDKEIINGFKEGNTIEQRVWQTNTNKEFQPQSEIIKGNRIYQKHGSVFFQLLEKKRVEINGKQLEIIMYPNPSSNNVTFQFSILPEKNTRIILTDIVGNHIISREAKSLLENLYIGNQPSGVYFVKILSGENYNIKKLIIN